MPASIVNKSVASAPAGMHVMTHVTVVVCRFGCGCYFAENSTKSLQYAHPDSSSAGHHFFIVSRVLLGNPQFTLKTLGKEFKMPSSKYDSVIAQSKKYDPAAAVNHREMVVYDGNRAYAEYILEVAKQ